MITLLFSPFGVLLLAGRGVLSLVERTVRDREVGGSNPLAPTTYLHHIFSLLESV